jgi:hypothetical protein
MVWKDRDPEQERADKAQRLFEEMTAHGSVLAQRAQEYESALAAFTKAGAALTDAYLTSSQLSRKFAALVVGPPEGR